MEQAAPAAVLTEQQDKDIALFLEETFRERPRHLETWKTLILKDEEATEHLRNALMEINALERPYLPEKNWILKALTFKPPSEIQAIVCAHDPIPIRQLVTGLAFSFPAVAPDARTEEMYGDIKLVLQGERYWCKGRAMVEMKRALRAAGVEKDDDFNYDYEHWAERGVLLWNAALTVLDGVSAPHLKHDFWLPFTRRLLLLILRESKHRPVLGMFWGTFAGSVHAYIVEMAEGDEASNCKSYDHPTFSENVPGEEYIPNASQQFASKPDLFNPRELRNLKRKTIS